MKCLIFLLLAITTAYAARSSILDQDRRSTRPWLDLDRDSDSDSDRSTGNRDGGSGRGRGSGKGGAALSSLGASGRIPENVRVEVEIVRLENPESLQGDGKKCKWIGSGCDTALTAFLDKDKPFSPVNQNEWNSWTSVWQKNGATSDDVGRSVTADVCGGAFNNVNLRVRARSSGLALTSELNYFDCPFRVRLSEIAASATEARFGQPVECRSKSVPGKHRLTVRERAYEIPESKCAAVAV